MKTYILKNLSQSEISGLIQRPKMDFSTVFEQVQPIIDEVVSRGDAAVEDLTERFDGVRPKQITLDPSGKTVKLSSETQKAIDTAFNNILRFHKAQMPTELEVETMPGVTCSRITRPVQRVGIYVPGGTAILPSSAMMLAVPAMLAGCETVVLATPPNQNGTVAPEILYIAQKAGVDKILLAGGAQAVAAMAYGTESVPKVDKILGPGNQYVTAAKMALQNSEAQISIDMPAGPSEVLVIADEQANPAFVAADLLSQAEHGKDSQVVLVATGSFRLEAMMKELDAQLDQLPRKKIAEQALKQSFVLLVDEPEEAFAFSNEYAPEHLIVNVKNADACTDLILNAGSVFLGNLTPESVGDYASGTNHTLPTYGYARMYSGVNLASFQKSITVQSLTEEGIRNIGPAVEQLAEVEGLQAHRNAVSVRLMELK